jgi:DNA-binding NarL/FixJ family response regulator
VLVLASPEVDGISRRERMLASGLVRHIAAPDRSEVRRESRVAFLERGLRRIALEIAQLTAGSAGTTEAMPHGMSERLRLLSPREWQVMERLRSGFRVVTIASELTISPNTVRNHLKSIYRKLGVRSQVELLERMRGSASVGAMGSPGRSTDCDGNRYSRDSRVPAPADRPAT